MDREIFVACIKVSAIVQTHPDCLVNPKDLVDYAIAVYRELELRTAGFESIPPKVI